LVAELDELADRAAREGNCLWSHVDTLQMGDHPGRCFPVSAMTKIKRNYKDYYFGWDLCQPVFGMWEKLAFSAVLKYGIRWAILRAYCLQLASVGPLLRGGRPDTVTSFDKNRTEI